MYEELWVLVEMRVTLSLFVHLRFDIVKKLGVRLKMHQLSTHLGCFGVRE